MPAILLIEDSVADITAFRQAVLDLEVEVDLQVATNAIQAFAFLQQRSPYEQAPRPDLVIVDLNLPAIDGHRIIEVIRDRPEWRELRIAVLTCSNREEDSARARLRGAEFHTKPQVWDEWVELCGRLVAGLPRR